MSAGTSRPALLLVHGSWHGAWCWDPVRAALRDRGVPALAVDLPSAGHPAGVADDARAVQAGLAALARRGGADGPVAVVAHSYGGIPVTQAATGDGGVSHLVYLAGYQLDAGESLYGHHGVPVPSEPDGMLPVPDDPVAMFYGDLPAPEAQLAARRLVPQSVRSFADPLTRAAWHGLPSTYVTCEKDRALPPENQEMLAARADAVRRLRSDHSPFLSMPGDLADLLLEIVTG